MKPTQAFNNVVVFAYEVVQGLGPPTQATKNLASALCDGDCLTFMPDRFIRLQLHRLCLTMTQKRNACKRNKKLPKVFARTQVRMLKVS